MGVTFVTALFLPSGPIFKPVSKYIELFECLARTNVPIVLYMDTRLREEGAELCIKYANIRRCTYTQVDTSWVPKNVILPTIRNEAKDTPDYMCIQLSKLKLVAEASEFVNTSHIAWIDFGIYHMFEDRDICNKLLNTITNANFPTDRILSPGCYTGGHHNLFEQICWWHCGSFLLGEKSLFPIAYARQTALVEEYLPRLIWEVNYWTMMNDCFTIYIANHNELLLYNLCDYICP